MAARHAHYDCSQGASSTALLGACLPLLAHETEKVLEKLNEKFNGLFHDCSIKIEYEQTTYGRASLVTLFCKNPFVFDSIALSKIIASVHDSDLGRNLGKLPDVIASLQEAELRISDYTTDFTLDKVELMEIACILVSLDLLDVETISCSPLPMGEGAVIVDGILQPLPLESSLHLMVGMKVCPGPHESNKEIVTRNICGLLRSLTIDDGIQRDRPDSSILEEVSAGTDNERRTGRLTIERRENETASKPSIPGNLPFKVDSLNHLEANLDDCTGEALSFCTEILLKNGAMDAWVTPIVMKKGRAAHTLHCLCHASDDITEKLLLVMFEQSTTLGIRIHRDIARAALHRSFLSVKTPFIGNVQHGKVNVKVGYIGRKVVSMKAEFDDCKAICLETGVPMKKISEYAIQEATRIMERDGTKVKGDDQE
mmetsp:Transcript_31505/g.47624  ORF Transcript_31505/g.47624 Transcript_31505/m.47624 type:complete len:427 (+) Transcript_31505:149-1429(+)